MLCTGPLRSRASPPEICIGDYTRKGLIVFRDSQRSCNPAACNPLMTSMAVFSAKSDLSRRCFMVDPPALCYGQGSAKVGHGKRPFYDLDFRTRRRPRRRPPDRPRSIPGSMPATSQLDWLISMTAMIVLFWSRATRDLLRSFGWGIGHSIVTCSDKVAIPRRPPHSVSRSRPCNQLSCARKCLCQVQSAACLRDAGFRRCRRIRGRRIHPSSHREGWPKHLSRPGLPHIERTFTSASWISLVEVQTSSGEPPSESAD